MKEDRKAVWRVACETCRKEEARYHCTWRFQSERGARNKINSIRNAEKNGQYIYIPIGYRCGDCIDITRTLVLEHWDGEKWVAQK